MITRKIEILENWFRRFSGTITAFSGGVDSSLVLFLSKNFLPASSIACISKSASLKTMDYDLAVEFCGEYDIPLEVIETGEVEDKNYYINSRDRCFVCKSHLYRKLKDVMAKYPGYTVLNGTNCDDFEDYRPGLKAAMEHGLRSPLAECHLTKNDIRELAKHFGLSNWDKPASPCLSSRVPYGQLITTVKLQQIESAEEILNNHGFRDVRVRHYEKVARIEVPNTMIEDLKMSFGPIEKAIRKLGFEKCVIDEEGFVSGKLNRSLIHQENGGSV